MNFGAECLVVILAAKKVIDRGWNHLWIESNSGSVVKTFLSNSIPWDLRGRWAYYTSRILRFRLSHIFREGNFGVVKVAKFVVSLREG